MLLSRPRAYARLVKRCLGIRLVSLSLQPKAELGVFFVHKKGDRQRLIIDCRRANSMCRRPPGVELLSSHGLGKVEAQAHLYGLSSHLGVGDVADCCHRLRLDGESARTSAGPGLRPSVWG